MRKDLGFTLIEMIVVVAIIVLIAVIAMPTVGSYFQVSLNSATRDLATTIKEAFNTASVTGRVTRIVYDLKSHTFWAESGPNDVLLDTKESKEKDARRKRSSSKVEEEKAKFGLETSITRKKVTLPRGVEYEDVVSQQTSEPITQGTAYTHFFPNGLTEQTIIHLKDQSNHHASLVISPLLGITDVYDRYITSKEAFEQK